MKTTSSRALALVVLTLSIHAISAQAAVIGYWRFESSPGLLADSGGNALDLSQGGNSTVTNPALAGTGATSAFLNPIPQTEAVNGSVANFGGSATDSYLARADSAEFAVTSFTLEAMFNRTNSVLASNRYIASQFLGTGNQRSWGFGTLATTQQLFVLLSSDGIASSQFNSTLTITVGLDYYTAFAFDLASGNATFYLQDLTNSGALQSETIATGLTGLKDSTGAFNIGTLGGSSTGKWVGSIDEVRLSNTALSSSELLAVPEPGPVALVVIGGMWVMIFRRSRRQPLL